MSKSIKEIKEEFEQTPWDKWHILFGQYENDERAGVKKLLETYRRKEEKEEESDPGWKRCVFMKRNTSLLLIFAASMK